MAEYIEKENLIKYIDSAVLWSAVTDRFQVLAEIKAFEKADVAPIVHDKWIEVEGDKLVGIDSNGKDMYRYYRYNICAKCGKRNVIKSNFCPNCGAKMDLE